MVHHDKVDRIGIVGMGARTPVGLTAASAAIAVRAGISRIAEHPFMIDRVGQPMRAAIDPILEPGMSGRERFFHLAKAPLIESLSPLMSAQVSGLRPAFILCLPEHHPGVPTDLQEYLPQALRKSLPPSWAPQDTIMIHSGHAAGILALDVGRKTILQGISECCIVGGVDSYLSAESLEWLDAAGRLKSYVNRAGFPPGEGAGFCVLASGGFIQRWRLPVLGWVISSGSAMEPSPLASDGICVGRGLSDAIALALRPLSSGGDKVHQTFCDLNGERYRSEEYAFAIHRVQLAMEDFTRFTTPVDSWGDMGAATGTLLAILALVYGMRGYASGPHSLLWAGSDSGKRAAALLYTDPRSGGRL